MSQAGLEPTLHTDVPSSSDDALGIELRLEFENLAFWFEIGVDVGCGDGMIGASIASFASA